MIKELTPEEKKAFNISSSEINNATEPEPTETKDVLDLDNVLDEAEHSYEIEKKDETNLEERTEDTETDTLDATLENKEPIIIVPQKKELKQEAPRNTDHIRTLHRDVSDLKSTGDANITSQMLRDARKDEFEHKEEASTQSQIKTFIIIGCILIVLAIGVFIFFTHYTKPTLDALPTAENIPSLIRADSHVPIDVTGAYHFKIKTMITDEIAKQETFEELAHFYFGRATRNGGEFLSTQEFFKVLHITLPTKLSEVLSEHFMLGTYTLQEPEPFLILTVTSFAIARDAMLVWEENMLRDFKDIFAFTKEQTEPEAFGAPFRNELLHNQNVRSLYVPLISTVTNEFMLPPPEETTVETEENEVAEPEVAEEETVPEEDAASTEEGEETPTELPTGETEETTPETEPTVEEAPVEESMPTILQGERIEDGEERVLLYTFINEYTLLITTHPDVIPEIVKRYTNRQVYTQ